MTGLLPAENSGLPGETPPSNESGSGRTWIDGAHDWIYDFAHGGTIWLDRQFVAEEEEPLPVPPSRFRLGVLSELTIGGLTDFELKPVIDFKTDIDLPNLERRLKLFVSTEDPAALPGEDAFEANNEIRVGASRDFFKNWDTSIGVKARWLPEAFANLQWAPKYSAGNRWTLYPKGKLFWDNESGVGVLTAFVGDRWQDRWLFRQTVSGKWNSEQQKDDFDDANDPKSRKFGDDGRGYRWAVTSLVGYVPSLLDGKDYGRRISGKDVAKGWGLRGRIRGDLVRPLSYQLTFLRKAPLYKDFLFYVVAPQLSWKRESDWEAEFSIRIGVEMLLWGDDPLR